MRRLFLALSVLLISGASAKGADIYYAQTAAGAANGQTSCANAKAFPVAGGDWVAGNTIHICNTTTSTINTNLITVGADGTSGNPITIKFETGATLNSPVWPGNPNTGCASNCGAIDTNNHNYITIDGGGTGVIQGTANGSSLANHSPSIGVYLRGDHLMLKNLTVKNLYLVTSNEGTLSCPGAGNCPGSNSVDVLVGGGSNVEVCNNTLSNAHVAIDSSSVSASFTSPPTSLCTATQASAGVNYYNNTLNDHGWQIHVGGNGYVNLFNNDITNWGPWFNPSGVNAYHLDGIIAFPGAAGVVHPYIWNNYIHGDFTNSSPTGFIFCTYGVTGSGSSCTIFNNLLVGTGATATAAQGIYFHSADGNPLGPHLIYNNTLSGFSTGQIYTDGDTTQVYTVKNNVFVSNGGYYMTINGTPTTNFTSNNNVFYGARNVCGPPCGFPGGKTLAQWQALGEDAASKEQNPLLATNFTLGAGSAAIGVGANLTSVGIIQLDTGGPLSFGTSYACSTGCLARPSSGAWDAGLYPYASGVSTPAAPTGLTATAAASTINLAWTQSTGTPAGYNILRSTVTGGPYTQIGSVTSGTTYADTGLANGTYYYVVNAYNSAGTSANSAQASAIVATACSINLNPNNLAFGSVTQGTASAIQSITITNLGTATCTSLVVANPSNPDYGQTNTCGITLAINATCSASVTFTPSVAGNDLSALAVSSNDPASPETAPLSGTGVAAAIVTPANVTLTSTYATKTSASAVVTFTNQSGVLITFSSIAFSGGSSAIFNVDSTPVGHCGASVANGATCTITFSATPTSNGTFSSTLVVTDSDPGSPHNILVTITARGHGIIKIGVTI